MTSNVPTSRPQITRAELASHYPQVDREKFPLLLIGVRGYYRDTMGVKGANDIGIYDDALFIDSPNVFAAFNANTDPSVTRPRIATLVPGLYFAHKIGLHKGYRALSQQMGKVTVSRHEAGLDTGFFGINIHRGGLKSTSSEGCQTIPPAQWDAFIALVEAEARRLYGKAWSTTTIPYVLLDGV